MSKKRGRAELETRRLEGARLLQRGAKPAEVSRRLQVSRTSVWRWEQALEANGRRALRKAPRTGRPPQLTDTEKKRLVVALEAGALAQGYATDLVDALSRRQAHREDQRQAVFGVGRVAAAQGTELLLPAAERPRHQARRTSHPPLEDEAGADTKKNCAKQGRTIVFIDESGVSERPHRVRTWAPRGKTPILQYSFTWNQLSAVAGDTSSSST